MTIKKIAAQLQKHISIKFPEYDATFYANRRNYYIHLGLDKSLFSFENYKQFLTEINNYLNDYLQSQFKGIFPPKLVLSTKWKHDCIIYSKVYNG